MKTNSLFKRLVSMLIVVLMICTLFPVTALAQPAKPTYDDLKLLLKVEIDCETEKNDKDIHDEITYDLLDNSEGLKPSFSVGEVKDKSCTVTVFSDRYIEKFSEAYLIEHSPEETEDISKEVKLKFEDGQWSLKNGSSPKTIEFEVVCKGKPVTPKKPDNRAVEGLLANSTVTIDCTSDSSHTDGNYPLATGTYTPGSVQGDAVNGYTCDITVDPTTYIAKYNETFNGHTLDPEVQSPKIILEYVVASGWQVKEGNASVTFTVKCKDEPEKVTYTLTYDANGGSGAPDPETKTVNVGESATFTVSSEKPTWENHTFLGWADSANSTSAVYVAGSKITTSSNKTIYAVWKENPPAPQPPSGTNLPRDLWINAVKIDCNNTKASHEYKTYGLLADSYQIGEVTGNATEGYECTVTVNSAKYIEEYNKTNAGHKAVATDPSSRTITLKYTGSAWTVKSGSAPVVFYVECETSAPAPKQPVATDLPQILWSEAVKIHCSVKTSHADATYGLLEGSYQIGEVTGNATEGYECTVTVNSAKYIEEYNKTNAGHKAVATDPSSRTITLEYTGSAWAVKSGSAPVVFYVECESPAPTTYTVTYKDGVGGKVFKDDVHTVKSGATTPAFVGGIPTRPGYVFAGWTPTVSKTVTGNATYTAIWRKVKDTTVIEIGGDNSSSSSSKEENPNTGAPVFVGVSVGALAAAK